MQCKDDNWALVTGNTVLPKSQLKPALSTTTHHILKPRHWKAKGAMDEEERRERRRRQRQRVVSCCKKFITFLFSHIGLAALVVGYSIMGGFLFKALEAPAEWQEKFRIRDAKEDVVFLLKDYAELLKVGQMNITEFQNRVRGSLDGFQHEIVIAIKEKGWDGNNDMGEASIQWSFPGALLYSVTVITTIGYGHIAPKTSEGRLVTIVYALIGIPLTFLYLSNIGNFLADAFRLFYKKVCCDVFCCKKCERKRKRERLKMRRRRELAAQRNTILGCPNDAFIGYGAADDTVPDLEGAYARHGVPLGLPGGNDNLALNMDPAFDDDHASMSQLTNRSSSHAHLLQEDGNQTSSNSQANISETALMDDNIRETAILDDDEGSDHDSKSLKRACGTPSSELHMSKGILDKLSDAKETAILDSEDEGMESTTKRAKSTGDLQELDHDGDEDEDLDKSGNYKSLPMRGRSMKVSKKDGKLSKKEQRALSKERAKQEKLLKKQAKKEKELERKKSKERDKSKEKNKDKDKKKDKNADKEAKGKEDKTGDSTAASGSTAEKAEGSGNVSKLNHSPLPKAKGGNRLQRKGTFSPERTKRKETELRRARSLRSRSVGPEVPITPRMGVKNKSFHVSDESFVTAQGESMLQLNQTPDSETLHEEDEETEEERHSEPIMVNNKSHALVNSTRAGAFSQHDMAIDIDSPYDQLELTEYTEMQGNPLNFVDDPFDYEDEDEDAKVTVPVSICLILIAGYIFAGSVLFTLWEEWDYLTGSYFCFITLSTIGFGDIVPGTDMKEWASSAKLVLCVLWLAFGLSLLAMCFNLMQEEVKEKIKRIARKIGLLRNDGEG